MVRLLTIALLATAAASVTQAEILYNASVDCFNSLTNSNSCVTVTLSWQNEIPAIRYVEVDDNTGRFLFSLTTPPFAQATGSILPNPQTISNLSPGVIAAITNSIVVPTSATVSDLSVTVSGQPCDSTSARLILQDVDHHDVAEVPFVATVTAIPEPSGWSFTGVGLVLLYLGTRIRRWVSVSMR